MRLLLLTAVLFCVDCNNNKQAVEQNIVNPLSFADTIRGNKKIWKDPLNGNLYPLPDSIGGKPVSFCTANPKIISLAKDFYKGAFRPGDNDSTTELLSHVTKDDSTIRPFYRWYLDFTTSISDGALGEYSGIPSLKYAIKFPGEFFEFMDEGFSSNRYKRWTEIIAYSGLADYTKKSTDIEKEIADQMLENCTSCGLNIKTRISEFAKDITDVLKLAD